MTSTSCSRAPGWRRVSGLFLAAGLLVFGLPAEGRGQKGDPANEAALRAAMREGTHVFRRMLFDKQFTGVGSFAELKDRPHETILIVLGDLRCLREVPGGLRSFVERGGAVLLASDRAVNEATHADVSQQLLATAGATINDGTVICLNGEPRRRYQGHDFCPFVFPVAGGGPNLFVVPGEGEPLPRGVATNLPSFLRPRQRLPGRVQPLAILPDLCAIDPGRDRRKAEGLHLFRVPLLFAVGGDLEKGRVLLLADHSLFINQMMLPSDNNNVEFTDNCLNYLSGEGRQRKRVLFVEDGLPRTDFDVPLKSLKLPVREVLGQLWANRQKVAVAIDKEIARREANDEHNTRLLAWLARRGLAPADLARVAVLVGSVLLLLYGAYRIVTRGRYRRDTAVPLMAQAVGMNLSAGALQEQRHQALLRAGNLYDSARQIARQWFGNGGLPPGPLPRIVVQGGWWQRRRVRRLIERLWALAYGAAPVAVSAGAYKRLLADLEDLGEEVASGKLVLREAA